jgi:hypothetical protein
MVAITSAFAAMCLLPVVLIKPGRIMTTATGELIVNPISFRGLGVLFAADVASVICPSRRNLCLS